MIVRCFQTFSDSGPEVLYQSGQFMFAPEQYAITGNDPSANATEMTIQELIMFANDQLLTERYRLDPWPLFAFGDVSSDRTLQLN